MAFSRLAPGSVRREGAEEPKSGGETTTAVETAAAAAAAGPAAANPGAPGAGRARTREAEGAGAAAETTPRAAQTRAARRRWRPSNAGRAPRQLLRLRTNGGQAVLKGERAADRGTHGRVAKWFASEGERGVLAKLLGTRSGCRPSWWPGVSAPHGNGAGLARSPAPRQLGASRIPNLKRERSPGCDPVAGARQVLPESRFQGSVDWDARKKPQKP